MGNSAKNQITINPENTIFSVKRMIERKFEDPMIQRDLKYWPFKVINEAGNNKRLL
jgi:molecular chaperone DnaK (HSP70)